MLLRDRLQTALKEAMKAKEAARLSTLRLINAAIKDREIAVRGEADGGEVGEPEILQIMGKMVKQRQESARAYEEGGRLELAEKELAEIGVIQEFLPRQMDADEVALAFEALRAAGKVAHFGVSNFTPAQFELLASRTPLVTNQIELHPLQRAPLADGTLDQLQRLRIRPMIWSPLAGGALLTGQGEAERRVQAALARIAQRHGCASATIAFAWLLRLPSRPVPVSGSHRIEALREALDALRITLDAQDWTEVWQAATGREVP